MEPKSETKSGAQHSHAGPPAPPNIHHTGVRVLHAHHLSGTATTPFPARVTAHACMVPAWALSAADSG